MRVADGAETLLTTVNIGTPKVLLENPALPQTLLVCGSDGNGRCLVLNTASAHLNQTPVTSDRVYGRAVGPESVAAVFTRAYLGTTGQNVSALFVAKQPAGLPHDEPIISARQLVPNGSSSYSLNIVKEQDGDGTYERKINSMYGHNYAINYTHGFSYRSFVFFVTVQRTSVTETSHLTTRLARVCTSNDNFYSYAEIELQCTSSGQYEPPRLEVTRHAVAQSAYLHGDSNEAALFVVFGQASSLVATRPDTSRGSGEFVLV